MIVVSDTSPVNYLVLIGHVEVLVSLFNEVIVPSAVFSELQHARTPDAVRQWTLNRRRGFNSDLRQASIRTFGWDVVRQRQSVWPQS